MKLLRRWPVVLSERQFSLARVGFALALAVAILIWVDLMMNWQDSGLLYRGAALAYLVLVSPSLPDVFQSYASYKEEYQRTFGGTSRKS
jgi:hypothetical protein